MDLQTFAETLLYGQTIEDKLISPSSFDYSKKRLALSGPPDYPGRPASLSLLKKGSSVKFPGDHELEHGTSRGIVMHFFANHELLAIELMAMALLRFPDAPLSFQKGIVKTIGEEQKHMRLYVGQMEKLGVGFGEVGVNSYFWDTMKNMESPIDYVVQLAMTFEQANLDFAWYYAHVFKKMQIDDCRDVMNTVYEDEVRHVQFGVHWFNQWRNPETTDWEAYCHQLPFPLTPARAKGKTFFDFIRKNTGLSEEFIGELKIFSHSKGRVPYVKFYNPDCDYESHLLGTTTKNKQTLELEHDLGCLMTYLSVGSDIVALKKKPSASFINYLQGIGVDIPQFIEVADWSDIPKEIKSRRIRGLHPWGFSPRIHELEGRCEKVAKDNSYSPKNMVAANVSPTNTPSTNVHSKEYSVGLFHAYHQAHQLELPVELEAIVCVTVEEVETAIDQLKAKGFANIVLKTAYGVAGQGVARLLDEPFQAAKKNWCVQQLKTQPMIVEPWLEKVFDLSMHYDIRAEGVKRIGFTRLINSAQGQYYGNISGKFSHIIPKDVIKSFYHQQNVSSGGFLEGLNRYGDYACEQLKLSGYSGPVCFDSLVYRVDGELRCKAGVEINPRYSMGRLCMALNSKIPFGKVGLLFLINLKDLSMAGYASFSELEWQLKECYPLKIEADNSAWLSGGTLLVDPAVSKKWSCCYFVGSDLAECETFMKKFKPSSAKVIGV